MHELADPDQAVYPGGESIGEEESPVEEGLGELSIGEL